MTLINTQIKLALRPEGLPKAETWNIEKNSIPDLKEGEILIENHYLSLDPAMRGWINQVRSYIPPVEIGEVMRGGTVGEVINSKNPKFPLGTFLSGWGGVQEYTVCDGSGYYRVDPNISPLPRYIGTLGMPGMTAYFGIIEEGKIKENDTVLVSGAAGAVGSVVGQISKIKGCRVIGIAGGKHKTDYLLNELGFDGVIDYKNENIMKGIKRECPKGIDVYFDNVGGEILDSALIFLRKNARIIICGAISQYNKKPIGPSNYLSLLVNRATMKGIVVFDYADRYKIAMKEMAGWILSGQLKSKEDIYEGIENFHETFLRLFNGKKLGKLILKIKK
tara:strand:+ start:757 stop:1758 length:1002 start_codon:yes stop_codon:yes gene_type:complete